MLVRTRLAPLGLVVLLVACSAPPAPTGTPSPPTSPVPSVAPTLGPTPTSPPSAAPSRAQVPLSPAHLLLVEGDYAAVAQQLQTQLATTPDEPARTEARYELALSLALNHDGQGALNVLATPGGDDRDPFVRGLALDTADRHAEAMQTLADYAGANPATAAAVWLEIAERELNARRPQQAADAAAHGLETAAPTAEKQRLLEVRAQALANLGDNDGAFDAHRQVLALATNDATLGEQLFRLAQASRDLGKRDAALQALQTALERFPSASTTADALRLLDELGGADQIDPYILGRARYFAVDYRNAVSAFDRYLQSDRDGPDAPSARLYRALASLTPGNEPNALRDLDAIADDPTQDSELAAQALLEAGQALEGLAEPDQAEQRYVKLLERFPRLDAAALASFRLGLDRFVRGDDADAVAAWDVLIARRDDLTPDDVSRALYWRAKALQRVGRATDAKSSLHDAAAVRPAGYYALRALDVLSQLNSSASPAAENVAGQDDAQVAQWFAARGLDLAAASQTVSGDPALLRAQAEARLGLFREANWEADELLQRYPDRADRLYVLASLFSRLDLSGAATKLGQAAYTAASLQSPQDAPAGLRKLAYPRPFENLTDEQAQKYGIDPLLLTSTLREASQFDPWSDNAATGAHGVAQISPVHADEAALALHATPTAVGARQQVEQQAWLLADRLRRYDGRPEAALAAIATTERLADGWLARAGADDADVLIESVDYEGVRAIVRDVLATRLGYAIVYGTTAGTDPIAARRPPPEPTAAWVKVARLNGDVPADAPIEPGDIANPGVPDVFTRGTTLMRDGNYDAAITTFSGTTERGAQLRLGEALLGADRAADAIKPLQAADAEQPGSTASFLLARAYAAIGRCDSAQSVFERFASANPGALAAQARVAQATCLQESGHADQAVPLLDQAAQTPDLPRLQTLDLRERLALARLRAGDAAGAAADYSALLAQARTAAYRAELNYDLGIIASESDRTDAAQRFASAVHLNPKGRAARAALDELSATQDPGALSIDAADTRFEQNRYREALAAYAANPDSAHAAYGRGVSLVRLGQERAGIAVLESMAQQFPNTADAADGLFRAARIRESLADSEGAASDYRAVVGQPNAGARANDARFRLAFIAFEHGDVAAAASGWRDLTTRVSDPESRAQASFWLGKALAASGTTDAAQAAWAAAAAADPHGFYGLRAADELAGRSDPRAAADAAVQAAQAHAVDDPLAAIATWAQSRPGGGAAQQRVESDPALATADALLAMGLRQPAIWELQDVAARFADDPPALAVLGGLEQRRGLYNAALALAYSITSEPTGPAPLRRLLYPLAHPVALAAAAQELHTDPLLFAALMRQESNMDQSVESAAQARGLSQLTAATAYDAARALGVYGFSSSDLYKPSVSIRLGAFTFGERLARYEQQIFPALAAYNAGTFSVDGWLLSAGPADIDTFAEAIPFTETYPYVQHIYENYRQYLEVYG